LTLEKGTIINKIKELFVNLGYHITYYKLNSKHFGVPQSRERVYIIGCLDGEKQIKTDTTFKNVYIKDVIEQDAKYTDIPEQLTKSLLKLHESKPLYGLRLQDKRGGSNNIHSWDIAYHGTITEEQQELMKKLMTERRKKHWAVKKEIKWMDGMPLTFEEIQTFYNPTGLQEMLDSLVSLRYLTLEKPKDIIDGKRQYKEKGEAGYNICKGKLSFPISKILDPNDVCPTLTATDSCKLAVVIDDKHIRRLTDIELKRICGFPEDFIIPPNVNKYDLFGNMVTPPVITGILEHILTT
jgi:DNA (cytosine-5)-methyltransferase 1